MYRRSLLKTAFALPVAALFPACGGKDRLALGIHPWPGYGPLFLAWHFGWLPEQVQPKQGRSAGDSMAGLQAGWLDAACLTLDETLRLRAQGVSLTVVLVLNHSAGADVVLARSGIDTLAALKGKRIAVEQGAVGAVVLHAMRLAAGLSDQDLTVIDVPVDQHADLWQRGEIDAAISYPPFSLYLERLGARRLFDSRQFPERIFDVLAVRQERLTQADRTLRQLVQADLRALDYLCLYREDALRRIAFWYRLSFAETEVAFRGLVLPNVEENYRLLMPEGRIVQVARRLQDAFPYLRAPLNGLVSWALLPKEV